MHCCCPAHGNSCCPFAGKLPEEWHELTNVQAIQLSINDLSGAFSTLPNLNASFHELCHHRWGDIDRCVALAHIHLRMCLLWLFDGM
jgi:hypothetical protein